MIRYFTALLAAKRHEPADDLLSALIAARDEADRLSENELVSMAFLLLVAGHETTVNLIASGVLALLLNPAELARLRADPSLIGGAVEELLRYVNPVNNATFRCAAEPVEIGGVRISRGDPVLVALSGANRDPARFGDPDRLDLGRDSSGHLAFGHGIHYCLGAPLARLEAEIAFSGLLARFGSMRLAVPAESLRWRPSTLIHGLESLPVRLYPYTPGSGKPRADPAGHPGYGGWWYTGPMGRLTEIAPGVLVATSSYAMTTSTVVVGSSGGCLLIDPAVTVADLAALAGELAELGLRPAVAWSTHPHWDHVLWSAELGDAAQVRRARRGDHRRDRTGRHPRVARASPRPVMISSWSAGCRPLDASAIPWDGPTAQADRARRARPGPRRGVPARTPAS